MSKLNKFPTEATRDRGQISIEELNTWTKFWHWRDEQEYLRKYGPADDRKPSDYSPGDSQFEECSPLGFGWKGLWIGVRTSDVEGVINTLSTGLIEKTKWVSDVRPAPHLSRFKGKLALVTPPCDGTVFIEPRYRNFSVAHYQHVINALGPNYANLSSNFGPVYCVWTFRTTDATGFIKWENGKVVRAVSSGIDDARTFGASVDGEKELRTVYGGGKAFWCDDLYEMSNYWGVWHNRITPLRPEEDAYCWFISVE